jgi:D-arabinose 1-dehydrogenase-like Zn-dependent alcohol dehydrogenase
MDAKRRAMRALILRGPRDAHVSEAPIPEPGHGEVLVKITACGICGSDLNAWRGVPGIEYPLAAGAPGHEAIGEVVALGPRVTSPRLGTTVTGLMWNGFAEYGVALADHMIAAPASLHEMPGEPLACAVNVLRRAALREGADVAFVGFGYLAALIVQFLPEGVNRWIALSRRPASRELASTLGAHAVYDFDDVPSDAWDTYPVVIESAGVQQSLDYATWLTSFGGRLVIAGYHADGPRTVNMQSWNWKGIDVINAHERKPEVYLDALRTAFDLLTQRRDLRALQRLHQQSWPLSDIGAAFLAAEQRPPGFFKALVRP